VLGFSQHGNDYFSFHRMLAIHREAEQVKASEGRCSVELVTEAEDEY